MRTKGASLFNISFNLFHSFLSKLFLCSLYIFLCITLICKYLYWKVLYKVACQFNQSILEETLPVLLGIEVLLLTNPWTRSAYLISYKTSTVIGSFYRSRLCSYSSSASSASALLITASRHACLAFPSARPLQLPTWLLLSQHCLCICARTMNNSTFLRNLYLYTWFYINH